MMAINQDDIKVLRLFNKAKYFLDIKTQNLLSSMLTPDEDLDLAEHKVTALEVDDEYVATQILALQMAYDDRMDLGDMHEHVVKK
jgi:hypothetical protein